MRWLIRIGVALGLAALCWLASLLWPQPAHSQSPELTATWSDSRELSVSWQAAEPVCVWLIGGKRQDTPLPTECTASGRVELPTGGVSADYAPQLREWIELRNANSQAIERLAVPERPSEVWVVILPIVVKSGGPVS